MLFLRKAFINIEVSNVSINNSIAKQYIQALFTIHHSPFTLFS